MRFRQVPSAAGQAGKLNAGGGPLKWWRSGRRISPPGEVVEWLMALVLKTSEVQASVGSNPTLSVSQTPRLGGVFVLKSVSFHWLILALQAAQGHTRF